VPVKQATAVDDATSPMLNAILNLTRFHREHEKFYASSPREQAVVLQRHARTLQALADQWSTAEPSDRAVFSPFEGAEDLNAPAATQLDGVLFMEGEGRPAELAHMVRDLRGMAEDFTGTGDWLADAMHASWDMAAVLVEIDGLAELLGERHRIIANDWLAADMTVLSGRLLTRAADMLEKIDFSPEALRADLAGERVCAARLYSIGEIIDRAADLQVEGSGLVHDNERRWRVFRRRVSEIVGRDAGGSPSESTRK